MLNMTGTKVKTKVPTGMKVLLGVSVAMLFISVGFAMAAVGGQLGTGQINSSTVQIAQVAPVVPFRGCRGNGTAVCVDAVQLALGSNATQAQIDRYYTDHPTCTRNLTCAGTFSNCSTSCPTPSSNLDVRGTIRLYGSTSGYVGLQPAVNAGSTIYTLPSTDGTAGKILSTNGAGVLSWIEGFSKYYIINDMAQNDFFGMGAGNTTMTGHGNTGVGQISLQQNTTGYNNTAFGVNSLAQNTTGSFNTGIGDSALESNLNASANTAVGRKALELVASGGKNTAVGYNSGGKLISGNYNIFLGNDAGGLGCVSQSSSVNNSMALGGGTCITADNQVVLGNDGVTQTLLKGKVGIGTANPTQVLEVNGGIRINVVTVKPACNLTTRGTSWFVQGGTGVKDSLQVCAKGASNDYAWRNIY